MVETEHSACSEELRIEKYKNVAVFSRSGNLRYAVEQVSVEGVYLEFGVFKGESINFIADLISPKTIYGFDSFVGLPEDWNLGEKTYKKGHFSMMGKPPKVRTNVKIVQGFFEDTLEKWVHENAQDISLLHIDCDIYSGAKCVLELLNKCIVPGTLIVLDELCDWRGSGQYGGWAEGEWKALNEWLRDYKRAVVPVSRGVCFESAVIIYR